MFGESVKNIYDALEISYQADLGLSIGSSLTVYPANLIPQTVKERRLIIIIIEDTPLDYIADIVIRDPVEIVLPCIVDALK